MFTFHGSVIDFTNIYISIATNKMQAEYKKLEQVRSSQLSPTCNNMGHAHSTHLNILYIKSDSVHMSSKN